MQGRGQFALHDAENARNVIFRLAGAVHVVNLCSKKPLVPEMFW
jgi:hypothetical protein